MKTKLFILSFICLCLSTSLLAQKIADLSAETELHQRGEVYFSFSIPAGADTLVLMNDLGRFLSIDHKNDSQIFAYANRIGFEKFLGYHFSYQVHTAPSMLLPKEVLEHQNLKSSEQWDYYPSYGEYIKLMQNFQKDYPDLCELVSIGKTVQGRDLLFIHFKSAKDSLGDKPQFMYTATMHGDETTPYILMLHLIDYLSKNYGKLPRVTHIMDSLDIWINPLANPDGTYAGGDSSVYGATRYNANHIDLNRNYPDPKDGNHPDGNAWQLETIAFMNFASAHHFTLSCNMHTGSEVANYPWDTWPRLHADDKWWQQVCRQYADTVHAHSPSGYFIDLNQGITNGHQWYSIDGGRQDYMNYFQHDREFTLEMSSVKMPDPSLLPTYWEDNYRSLIDYMEQGLYGIRGHVYDSITGESLMAKIYVVAHDTDHSEVYSSLPSGIFFRPIAQGTYQIQISAAGYLTKTIDSIGISQNQSYFISTCLKPKAEGVETHAALSFKIYPNPASQFVNILFPASIGKWEVINMMGQLMRSGKGTAARINISKWPSGTYFIRAGNGRKMTVRAFQVR